MKFIGNNSRCIRVTNPKASSAPAFAIKRTIEYNTISDVFLSKKHTHIEAPSPKTKLNIWPILLENFFCKGPYKSIVKQQSPDTMELMKISPGIYLMKKLSK